MPREDQDSSGRSEGDILSDPTTLVLNGGAILIPSEHQIELEDGVYMIRLHRGELAPASSYDTAQVGQMLHLSSSVVVKVVSVVTSDDGNDIYLKVAVLNGFAWLPAILGFLLVASVIILFDYTVTNVTKLTEALTAEETSTDTYTDASGQNHTVVKTTKKPPNLNPLTGLAALVPLLAVAGIGYVLFFTPFGRKLLA